MVDTPKTPVVVARTTPKKSPKAKKERKAAAKPSHPSTTVMVNTAVKELKERGGSSLQAIKKYLAATYKVDADKLAPFIRKAIKSSVESGALVQTKGTGASGSFKIPVPVKGDKTKKPAAKPKVAKPKTAAVKKSPIAKSKKSPITKKVVTAKPKKSPAKKPAAKPKSPPKTKKIAKVTAKKPKSPKAKSSKKAVKTPKKK